MVGGLGGWGVASGQLDSLLRAKPTATEQPAVSSTTTGCCDGANKAATLAAITWAVEGSLIGRAMFLAAAGAVAVGLAIALGRIKPKESRA